MRCRPKSYKLKLLGKLIVQHSIRALLGERLYVQASLHDYFPNLLHPQVSPKAADFDCFPKGLCVCPCAHMGLHMRDMISEPHFVWVCGRT